MLGLLKKEWYPVQSVLNERLTAPKLAAMIEERKEMTEELGTEPNKTYFGRCCCIFCIFGMI
jgi:hypothetical protein